MIVPSMQADTDTVFVQPFGKTPTGEEVKLYTLTNRHGMTVRIMDYGATVVDLLVPDRKGHLSDVALGFSEFSPYLRQKAYLGATIGRYGNRIAKGRFSLDGQTFQLATNNGVNTLHGGVNGFDKRLWQVETKSVTPSSVTFRYLSADGEENYPGALQVQVTFYLTAENDLIIHYLATTNRATIVNLTNHTYFNLAGAGEGSILDHQLTLNAEAFTPVDNALIPTGEIESVRGTVMDFTHPTAIGARIQQVGGTPVGYDHNYVLRGKGEEFSRPLPFAEKVRLPLAAEVAEPKSGRLMKVYTDQPAIQFYSGNFLDGSLIGKGGKVYPQYSGFCLETQHYPDSPNEPKFPDTVLRPGQTYRTTTIYSFTVR